MIAEGCEVGWIKAASVGKGPQYVRPSDIIRRQGHKSIWDSTRRINNKMDEMHRQGRLVLIKSEQAHYAVGLLGFSDVLEHLELRDTMNTVAQGMDRVTLEDNDADDEKF
jgi:trehalose-6-phosphate synthase